MESVIKKSLLLSLLLMGEVYSLEGNFNETKCFDVPKLCCKRGPRGHRGHKGKPGATGATGAMGSTGATGAAGTDASLVPPFNMQWVEDVNDPIYNPFPDIALQEDYFPWVVFDQNSFSGHGDSVQYKMWHQGDSGQLAISNSNDGINWTFVSQTNLPINGSYHACVLYDAGAFGGGGFFYKIWFWSGTPTVTTASLQYAESNDGITWSNVQSVTQNLSAPLVDGVSPGFFYHLCGPGYVRYNPNATSIPGQPFTSLYVMFYDISTEGAGPGSNIESIAVAFSNDGLFWSRYGIIPVLIPDGIGAPGPITNEMFGWDYSHVFRASVVIDNFGVYHLFYSGSNTNINNGLSYAHGIGHAVSRDGVTWSTDWANPLFYYNNGKAWRMGRTYAPCVLFESFDGNPNNLQWKMWFSGGSDATAGQNQGIGYATLVPVS